MYIKGGDFMSDLGNKTVMAQNLYYYMALNNKNRQEICNDLGFKYTTFCDWLNGKTYPRIDKIEMLANYFNIKKSDLVEDKSKNSELDEYLEELRTRPEMKMLFNITKNATKEEVEKAVKIIEAMLGD